jgi:spore photoproduct lyase
MATSLERFLGRQDLFSKKVAEIKVEKGLFRNLKGELEERVKKVGDGSIICLFYKTPYPEKPTDVVCPHFLELKWANGCYFDCAWCYLNGTYRFHPEWKKRPNIKDYAKIKLHLEVFLGSNSKPEILNAGELSDSLITEHTSKPFSSLLGELFSANHTKHRVLFLTKSNRVGNILKQNLQKYLIMSFTLNAEKVSETWEKGAPRVSKRIEAAKKVFEAGYTTRIRIDPMVPIASWERHYANLIDDIFSNFIPERITIGSLRGLQSTINQAKDRSWVPYVTERSNWGKKIPLETRHRMYSTLINYLEKEYDYDRVALCKETVEIWERLKLDYKEIKCNCIN